MKNKKTFFGWADDGPFLSQQNKQMEQSKCEYFLNEKSLRYCCKNIVYKFNLFNEIKFTKNNEIPNDCKRMVAWKNQLLNFDIGLCKDHILFLNKKYNIDLIKSIIDFYQKDIGENNDWSLNLIYELRNNQNLKKEYKEDAFNLEVAWIFQDIYLTYPTIPMWLLSNFSFFKYNGKNSQNQGLINGPDFLFKFKNNKEKYQYVVGLEIVTLDQNMSLSFCSEQAFAKHSLNGVYKRIDFESFEDYLFNKACNLVDKKNNQSKKYEYTNALYLGILLNNVSANYHYFLLRILLKRKYENCSFDDFFII